MKSSRFIAGLVVLVIVQIGALAVFQRWTSKRSDCNTPAAVAAEADAARVFSRSLVSELQRDPDYELRKRLITYAKLHAIETIRRSRASPQHVVMTLAKLDELARYSPTIVYQEHWPNQSRRQQRAQHPQIRRPPARPELSEEDKLMRELDRQLVPRRLDDISRMLDAYDRPQNRKHDTDQTF